MYQIVITRPTWASFLADVEVGDQAAVAVPRAERDPELFTGYVVKASPPTIRAQVMLGEMEVVLEETHRVTLYKKPKP